jgi:hypothetical protein
MKTIVQYLHRTRNMGTIINPTGELTLNCYVDADFAGLYMRNPSDSPTGVKSCTGYVIMLGNAPSSGEANFSPASPCVHRKQNITPCLN